VPHLLTGELRVKRKELTGLLIPDLEAARKDGWKHLVTRDESWFFLLSVPRRMWLWPKMKWQQKVKPMSKPKYSCLQSCGIHMGSMLSIGWRLGPKSTAHTIPLTFFSHSTRTPFRKGEIGMIMHIDNCLVHRSVTTESFMKTRDMASMQHPPYSPDLAPSDFCSFLTVKERLELAGITDEYQLFEELQIFMRLIPGEELERVFDAWRESVQDVNQGDGGYIDS
jgi:histone-lysine N-methyltransferase SETMAR